MSIRIGLIGARGYVGSELIRMVAGHPEFELAFISSRERVGQAVATHESAYRGNLDYVNLDADTAARQSVDALILALPNDMAATYVAAVDQHAPDTVLLDLSADYRFDASWYYGLPELTRAEATGKKRISNPGCYATAMQLAIAPISDLIAGPVQCFGVSGYSGAGTSPSDKNNPETLRDNLIPYHLTGHVHEREVSFHRQHAIEFMPHVAAYFRGLSVTSNIHLMHAMPLHGLIEMYETYYVNEPLVSVTHEVPWVSRCANKPGAQIGGFSLSASHQRLVVVSALDNLLKGAATQAIQNLNLAFGLEELAGIQL